MGAVYQGIPQITVNGVSGKFANGWIYNYDFTIGYSEEPNKLTLSMVLDDNTKDFQSIPINLKSNVYTISFGGYSFAGYLFSSRIEINSSEKILHCTFVDKSIILDQVYVGLKYRFAFGEGENYHILIGEEVEVENPTEPEEPSETRCISCSSLEEVVVPSPQGDPSCDNGGGGGDTTNKYDVQYKFTNLIQQINRFIPCDYITVYGGDEWGSYTGTLREVLSSWGSDKGFSFYFDGSSLRFIQLNGGIPVVVGNPNTSKVKSYSAESTAEGSYAQGAGTFSSKAEQAKNNRLSTRTYTFTKETYQQISLTYAGPDYNFDVQLGLLGAADAESRDNYCKALGLYSRIGFVSPYGVNYSNLSLYPPKVKQFAEAISDTNLMSLASQAWVSVIFAEINEDVKNFYTQAEKVALDSYGKLYKVNGAVPPVNRTDVECIGSSFRKITTYEWYPDFNDQGRWMKDTGTVTVGELQKLWSQGNTVYSLEGTTKVAFFQAFSEAAGFANENKRWGIVFLGGSAFYTPTTNKSPNTSEEEDHYPNARPWEHHCPLQCENYTDPCDAFLQCSSDKYNVRQGITDKGGYMAGNVITPSTSPFIGWHKTNEEYTKVFPGNISSQSQGKGIGPGNEQGSMPDARDRASCRYLLIDTSNGGGAVGAGGGAGYQSSISYEFIGLPEGINLNPSLGLSSLSINLSSNGLFSKVTFQSRPNPPLQERTLQKITPRKTLFR